MISDIHILSLPDTIIFLKGNIFEFTFSVFNDLGSDGEVLNGNHHSTKLLSKKNPKCFQGIKTQREFLQHHIT